MKKVLLLTLGFIVVIITGYLLNENVKKAAAASVGYDNYYLPAFARCMFYNIPLNDQLLKIRDDYKSKGDTTQSFRNDPEWIKLKEIDEKGYAFIEFSGYLFTLLISIAGLMTWLIRRKRNIAIKWYDWLILMFGFFFMREVIVMLNGIFFHGLCNETNIWKYIGLNWFYSYITCSAIGILSLISIIIFIVPKADRLKFILSGFFGSIVSCILIIRYIGYYL